MSGGDPSLGWSRRCWLTAAVAAAAGALGCDVRDFARRHGAKLRLSIATGGTGGVYYPYGGALARLVSLHVPGVEATAEVTGGSVDNLNFIRLGKADIGFTLADTLHDAALGRGAFQAAGAVPVRALAVLYTNHTQIATFASGGRRRLADLRGAVVSTGAAGSGTELVALRVLEEAGVDPSTALRRQALGVSQSVDALRDGKIDALFWSGGVPTAALIDLGRTPGRRMVLIPSGEVVAGLRRRYGPVYVPAVVPRGAYPDLEEDVAVVGVANVLVADRGLAEPIAYEVTRLLFERAAELAAVHPEARHLNLETAVREAPVPFHEGAIRFYRERKVWPG